MITQNEAVPLGIIPDMSSAKKFKSEFKGKIISATEEGYDEARRVWNSMIDKKPLLIACCTGTDDIIAAVNFARSNNILISVKGGGHNVAGNAVCEGGLMIDLSPMKSIHVDAVNRVAIAEPGVLWQELDEATMAHGLATTGGTVSDTGIAGLTLGGGIGWLMGKHGTASDNLLSAEVITADGKLLIADANNNTDLYWAIRGGGGNFGIVSKFTYRLHPVQTTVVAGMLLYPMEQAKDVFAFYRDYIRKAPDELMSYSGFIVTPDGVPVTMLFPAWMGPIEEAETHLGPLRKFLTPIADMVTEMPYTQLQKLLDNAAPPGIRRYWKSGFFTELSDELIDIYLKHIAERPSPLTPVLFFHLRGAGARVDPGATAFVNRKDQWDTDIISQWTDPADDNKNIEWTKKFWKEIAPISRGVYINHLDSDDGNDRVKNSYGANYTRLQEIKKKYDPDNFFKLNNNIPPA